MAVLQGLEHAAVGAAGSVVHLVEGRGAAAVGIAELGYVAAEAVVVGGADGAVPHHGVAHRRYVGSRAAGAELHIQHVGHGQLALFRLKDIPHIDVGAAAVPQVALGGLAGVVAPGVGG